MPIVYTLATLGVLELIGYLFNFTPLMFFSFQVTPSGFLMTWGILPYILTVIVGVITERIYKKQRKT
jgi:uncharacterized PurR-regulated membrane protein YhhQ (DUF165 family)